MAKESRVWIRLRDKKSGSESKEVPVEDFIFEEDIEFEFDESNNPNEILDYTTLPYKDFLFFKDDYDVIIRIGLVKKED